MVQKGPDRPKRVTFKISPNRHIFVNGAFVALCVTTILPNGPITISLFVSELEKYEWEVRFF